MSPARNDLLVLLLIVVGIAFVYSNSLTNSFTFDDHAIIERNPVLAEGSVREIAASPFWPNQPEHGLYRPVTLLTLSANRWVNGLDPLGYRVVNILFHALVVWLLYLVLLPFYGRGAAAAGAAMFGLHPIQTESVNAVVGRAELLSCGWMLLAWLAHRRSEEHRNVIGVSVLAYILASLSKEHALVFPAFVIAEDFLKKETPIRERLVEMRQDWGRYVPFAAAGLIVLSIRAYVVGSVVLPSVPDYVDNPLAHVGGFERVATGIGILSRYVGLVLVPMALSVDYSFGQIPIAVDLVNGHVIAGIILLAVFLQTIQRSIVGSIDGVIGLACFVVGLAWLPTSNLLFPIGTPMAERLMYMPMVGFAIMGAAGYARLEAGLGFCPPWAFALTVCVLFGARTSVRNVDWKDDFTLFSSAVQVSPNSAKAYFNFGNALRDTGNQAGALDAYRRAVDIYPGYAEVHYNAGVIYQDAERIDEALSSYQTALDAQPDHVSALVNRGILLVRSGNADAGVELLRSAARVAPERSTVHFNLGVAEERLDHNRAIAAYRRALDLSPSYADAAINLGMLFRQAGNSDATILVYQDLLKSDPDAYQVAYNLGVELERTDRSTEALRAFRTSWVGGREVGVFSRFRMGQLFARSGQVDSARLALSEFLWSWQGDPGTADSATRILDQLTDR